MEGWIRLHRAIREHWIWKDPNKLKWWLDILLSVNHAPTKVNVGWQVYECGRGQSIQSISTWAKQWGVSKDTARNFLTLLEKDGMIKKENLDSGLTRQSTLKHTRSVTRLTVCNYDSYQAELHDNLHDSTPNRGTKQECKRMNNNSIKSDYSNANFDFVSDDLKPVFMEWLDYKKTGFKFTYKTQRTLELAYQELLELSQGNAQTARAIVERSMKNGWKGLFAQSNKQVINNQRGGLAPTGSDTDSMCAVGFATGSTL